MRFNYLRTQEASEHSKKVGVTDVTHLHEEAGDQRSADVDVVVSAAELGAPPRQVEALHDPGQLLPHVVRRHQRAVVDEIVVAPLGGLVVYVRQGGGTRVKVSGRG